MSSVLRPSAPDDQANTGAALGGRTSRLLDRLARAVGTVNFWLQVIGAVFGLRGQWLVGAHSASGFGCWLVSNAALIALQIRTRHGVLVGLHCIYFVLSVKAIVDWTST